MSAGEEIETFHNRLGRQNPGGVGEHAWWETVVDLQEVMRCCRQE
jgi:hypothetical protein